MDRELAVVLGMSISYIASLAGMFIAMWAYKKNQRRKKGQSGQQSKDSTSPPTN